MPLHMPVHHKPDLTDDTVVVLALLNEVGRRVNVVVWGKAVERHGKTLGYKEPFIDNNRNRVFGEAMDRLIAEASQAYDAFDPPRPNNFEMR